MLIGYLFLAVFAGSCGFVFSLVLGTSFWVALGVYSLVGAITMIALPLANVIAWKLSDRQEAETVTN